MVAADQQFSYREDLVQYLDFPVATKVTKKFASSFDAEIQGGILHFTANLAALTPLSLLLPEGVIDAAVPGWPVVLQADSLCVGVHEFRATAAIKRIAPSEQVDWLILPSNLRQLRRNLELFGRSSPVLDLVLQRQHPPYPLRGVAELLAGGEHNLLEFAPFLGIGEGLTPSFDDFLAGMLFVDRFYGFAGFVVPETFWELAASKTTRQSVQQYRFSADGHFSRQFEELAADLTRRQVGAAELVRLLGWGHSSGTDILCGIWLYLSQQVKIDVKI